MECCGSISGIRKGVLHERAIQLIHRSLGDFSNTCNYAYYCHASYGGSAVPVVMLGEMLSGVFFMSAKPCRGAEQA